MAKEIDGAKYDANYNAKPEKMCNTADYDAPHCDAPSDHADEMYSQRLNRLLAESRRALEDLEVARRRTAHERDAARAEVATLRADLKAALGIARRLVG